MILDIYKDAIEYSAKDWIKLVILGVMCLFSFLLIPIFLLVGYNYRVINVAVQGIINGRDPLPDFDDLVGMFVDGVKVAIVQIGYFLVPVIIFIIFAIIAGQLTGVLSSGFMLIGCLVTLIVGVIAYLMSQMGICHMAYHEGEFTKAFALKEIKEAIDEIGWFECILTFIGLIIITVVISVVVTVLIGIIFAVFGISGSILGADPSGVFVLGAFINSLISMFIVGPYLSIFNGRSIGLLYSMQA